MFKGIRHPAAYYIKFLLTNPLYKDGSKINSKLVNMGFNEVPKAEIDKEIKRLNKCMPKNFDPKSKSNSESVKFLRDEGIYSLYNKSIATKIAMMLLKGDDKIRKVAQALSLTYLDVEHCAAVLNELFSLGITSEGFRLFSHFFWNRSALTLEEWENYIGKGYWSEIYLMALFGDDKSVLFLVGGDVGDELDMLECVSSLYKTVYHRARLYDAITPMSEDKLKTLMSSVRTLASVRKQAQEHSSSIKNVIKELERLTLNALGNQNVPSVKEVTNNPDRGLPFNSSNLKTIKEQDKGDAEEGSDSTD